MKITFRKDSFGDECCKEVYNDGEYIGCWCRHTRRLVINGDIVGAFSSEGDIKTNLIQKEVPILIWGRK